MVLFGGFGTSALGDTWEYDGLQSNWTQRTVTGPSARGYAQAAFDASRGVMVLFGGYDNSFSLLNDTWEWNGMSWTRRMPSVSPPGRVNAGMAYDPVRQRVVLFGGEGSGSLSDTWEWNGTMWTQRSVTGPAIASTALIYDPVRSRLVAVGGMLAGNPIADTWELAGTGSWTQNSAATGLPARYALAGAWHGLLGRLVVANGTDGATMFSGSYESSGGTWTAHPTSPTARGWTQMVYDSVRGRLVLFGGYSSTGNLSDTWEYY